ncbi:MAG: DUF3325 family protein [Acidobacteriota bacterium]
MMPATICGVFAACLALGGTMAHQGKESPLARHPGRRSWVLFAGWILLALCLAAFIAQQGGEVGAAYFLIWAALAALFATAWLSLWPRSSLWIAVLWLTAGAVAWIL